jgi:hypothetical protein
MGRCSERQETALNFRFQRQPKSRATANALQPPICPLRVIVEIPMQGRAASGDDGHGQLCSGQVGWLVSGLFAGSGCGGMTCEIDRESMGTALQGV